MNPGREFSTGKPEKSLANSRTRSTYRQVKGYARLKGKDPTKTIISFVSFVAKLREDLVAAQAGPVAWRAAAAEAA
jgi:hypothetical protein